MNTDKEQRNPISALSTAGAEYSARRNRVSQWHKVGGPEAGTVAALAAGGKPATSNGHTLFIGTKVGLYRSSGFDGGAAPGWERLTAAPLGVMSLAVSPSFASDH